MSNYHGKLLELLAIDNQSNEHFLHINVSFTEDIEVRWKIDEYTANNLRSITKFDEKVRYRLSLNSSWDSTKKQHISTLTRTYLDQSERVYFPCSEDYINHLSHVRSCQAIHDLDRQSSRPTPPDTVNLAHDPKQDMQAKSIIKPIYVSLIIITCFLFGIVLGYSGLFYLTRTPFDHQAYIERSLSDPTLSNHMLP